MDYSVRDSSIRQNEDAYSSYNRKDAAIRIGMVREMRIVADGSTRYIVEVFISGNQVPVSCQLMTRWGGVYNFEEYRIRSWASNVPSGFLPPTTAGSYEFRSGDTVVVGFVNGKSREGVILGGIRHEARQEELADDIAYVSRFNGLETTIDAAGAYAVKFNGAPVNEARLKIPGVNISAPIYNPLIAGSFFGFDPNGSYTVSDGTQSIVINKSAASGSITLTSGKNTITLGGNPAIGETTLVTDTLSVSTQQTEIKSQLSLKVETLQMSLKGTQVAIGNDTIELIDGLIQLIDGLGSVIVTSPVGTCTPLQASPTWASIVVPLKIKFQTLKGSL